MSRLNFGILLFFVICALTKTSFLSSNKARLPHHLEAIHYDLWIKPYFAAPGVNFEPEKDHTFEGKTTLLVKVIEDSDQFVINAMSLNITSYHVIDDLSNVIPIKSIVTEARKQQISLISEKGSISKGSNYSITIEYTGRILEDADRGLFSKSFVDKKSKRHVLIATQLESTDARFVYPCLDEPAYKATFSLTLEYPSSQVALSNMEETTPKDLGNGWSSIEFPPTPKMSTYLLAFAVGPFVNQSFVNKHNTLVRSWGWLDSESYLSFSAQAGGEFLYHLGEYTGIKFPLKKLDNVGIPPFGMAMENWGMVIYGSSLLFYNRNTMTMTKKFSILEFVSHELSHQWFGNLVTTADWGNVFLNEGMTTFFSYTVRKLVYPEQIEFFDSAQIHDELQIALSEDKTTNIHPLVNDGSFFDKITYRKGSSVIRVVSDLIGPNVLQQAIQQYLRKHQYGNVKHDNLFSELTNAAQQSKISGWCGNDLNVTELLNTYVFEPHASLIFIRSDEKKQTTSITQEPFIEIQKATEWVVPLKIQSLKNAEYTYTVWLTGENCTKKDTEDSAELFENFGYVTNAVYGRVIYDDYGFEKLTRHIAKNDAPNDVKLSLILDELFYIERERNAGRRHSHARLIKLLTIIFNSDTFVNNPNFYLFKAAKKVLADLEITLGKGSVKSDIQEIYQALFTKVYSSTSWSENGDWSRDAFLGPFLYTAVKYNIGDVKEQTGKMMKNIMQSCKKQNYDHTIGNCNPYSADLRKGIYCGARKFFPENQDFVKFLLKERFFMLLSPARPNIDYDEESFPKDDDCAPV